VEKGPHGPERKTDMNKEEIARRWTASTVLVAAFNLIMLVTGALVLITTETSWNRCMADVDQSRGLELSICQDSLINGQLTLLVLVLPLWFLGDVAFAVWLSRRRSAGKGSGPATRAALLLTGIGASAAVLVGVVFAMWV
jgi:hypothetical protein